MNRNEAFETAIRDSEFGSISRLAEHLGLHYRNVQSYALFERRPVDRAGIVKYDIAAICEALGCDLESLFPKDFIDRPYELRETYDDGYGQRAKRVPVERYHEDRALSLAEARKVVGLLEFSELVDDKIVRKFALDIVRRLRPNHYAALRAWLVGEAGDRKEFEATVRALNAPDNLRRLQDMKRR